MIRTIAILPVKSLGAAKQRLSTLLDRGPRELLAEAMFSDVLTALGAVRGVEEVVVVTADPAAESRSRESGVTLLRDREEAGQSAAALIGIRHALAAEYERVLLVPGDTPLLDAVEIDRLLSDCEAAGTGLAIVPDRHESGTNALLIAPPTAITPSFGPGSLQRHRDAARAADVTHVVEALPSLVLDVDTPEDLAELRRQLEDDPSRAPRTRDALAQLELAPAGATRVRA